MSVPSSAGLPEALERAAGALPDAAEGIRPANGDPTRLLELLDTDTAARVLEWLLGNEPADGVELAGLWAEDPEAGAGALLRVDAARLPKAGRKTLRRIHHRLRSRGVEMPEEELAKVVATLPPVEEALDHALVSSLDPRGMRAVYLVEAHPAGGARIFEVMLDDERGVVELEVYSASRGKARRFLRDLTGRATLPAVETPPAAARALIGGIAATQPAGRPLPRAFTEWRSHVALAPGSTATPGELAREALGDESTPERIERVLALLRERELGPWLPASEKLQRWAEKLSELTRGKIIVSGAHRREQAGQLLDEALTDLYAEPWDSRSAARLEESAYVLWKRGQDEDARACLAAARGFREIVPSENPVARAMLELLLAPVLQKLDEESGDDEPAAAIIEP